MKAFLKLILLKPLYNLLILFVVLAPNHSVGVAVVVLTIIIRVALLPMTKSITRQQALMTKLKPELDEIKDKNKDDKAKQASEMMAFYKKHHINPAGACLPMILQLVILLVLYYVFRIGINSARFDLLYSFTPRPDQMNPIFFGINLAEPDLWILPIIAGALQFYQTFQMLPKGKAANDPSQAAQRQMVYFFPIITIVVARRFPAALPLYWAISSIISIIQQHFILKQTSKLTLAQADAVAKSEDEDAAIAKIEEKSSKKGVEITVRRKQSE